MLVITAIVWETIRIGLVSLIIFLVKDIDSGTYNHRDSTQKIVWKKNNGKYTKTIYIQKRYIISLYTI